MVIVLIVSTLILTGCGKTSPAKQVQPQQQSTQQQNDEEEMSWFEDEVLDMDDWGESKHKKVKPKTDSSKPSVKTTTPTKPKSSSKAKSSTTKKKQ